MFYELDYDLEDAIYRLFTEQCLPPPYTDAAVGVNVTPLPDTSIQCSAQRHWCNAKEVYIMKHCNGRDPDEGIDETEKDSGSVFPIRFEEA